MTIHNILSKMTLLESAVNNPAASRQPAATKTIRSGKLSSGGIAESIIKEFGYTGNGAITENFKVTQSGTSGIELTSQDGTKLVLPHDKANALQANPQDPTKLTLSTDAMKNQSQQTQPDGPKVGTEVEFNGEIPTIESNDEDDEDLIPHNLDIGGDPTDDFIDDVVDHDYEKANRGYDLDRIKRLSGISHEDK